MATICFHGSLNDLYPEGIKVVASSIHEAISCLKQYAGFNPRKDKRRTVAIDGVQSLSQLHEKIDDDHVIHVRPVELGAGGRGGGMQVILGIVLIIVGFFTASYDGGATMAAGIAMLAGGILQMMMPQPKLDGYNDSQTKSQYLGARGNTVTIGTTIPIIFGRCKAWGHYLSFDVDARDLNTAPAAWYSSPFTDMGEETYSAAPEEVPSLDPQEETGIPVVSFLGISSGRLNFSPAVDLPQGLLDATFNNGRTVNCMNNVSGVTSYVTLNGGNLDNLPANGTPIIFTQNYV